MPDSRHAGAPVTANAVRVIGQIAETSIHGDTRAVFEISAGRVACEGELLPIVLEAAGIAGNLLVQADALADMDRHGETADRQRDQTQSALYFFSRRLVERITHHFSILVEVTPRHGCPRFYAHGGARRRP